MHPPVSAERWAAIRAIREGSYPSYALIGVAAELHEVTIRHRAAKEGWAKRRQPSRKAIDVASAAAVGSDSLALPDLAELERLASDGASPVDLAALVLAQVEAILQAARAGRVDKGRIDAVSALMRMAERAEQFRRDPAAKNNTRSDEELAAILLRLDDRVVELARDYAERLVRGEPEWRGG